MSRDTFFVCDFDGVFCDSTPECMVTAWNAWSTYIGRGSRRQSPKDFTDEQCAEFSALRPRVRGAGEFLVVQRAIELGLTINSNEDYEKYVDQWSGELEPFRRIFLEERSDLRQHDTVAWLDMHVKFDFLIDFFRKAQETKSIRIATLKDSDSVQQLLQYWNIHVDARDIMGSEIISSKLQAAQIVASEFSIRPKDIVVIDDNCSHLIAPLREGFIVYQTSWGNILSECFSISAGLGIPLLGERDLSRLLITPQHQGET